MANGDELSLVQENIDEFVNDENKIITCKWLSLTLNLQINTAKRALYTFVERQRKGKDGNEINVTYFVAGLGKSKSGELELKCVVVPETELDVVKKALLAVTSCHIYSVQKAKLKDYTPLYQTDYDVIKQNLDQSSRLSSIRCDWVEQRVVRQPAAAVEKPSSVPKTEKNESPAAGVSTSSSLSSKTNNAKKAEPKSRIASMFAAVTATVGQKKGEDEVAKSAASKPSDKKTVNPTEKKGGVRSFFSTNAASKKSPSENGNSKQAVKTEEELVITAKVEESDEEPDRKRRRRIRTDLFDSSESEEEEEPVEDRESPVLFESENKDDDEEKDKSSNTVEVEECSKPSRILENVENTNSISNGGERKRKRAKKTVTKQYQDEEGFLVTKKEVVWESESDNSEPEEVVVVVEAEKTKPNTAAVKQSNKPINHKTEAKGRKTSKKVASPQKGKQQTLTSFFTKK
ncbi:unnamed protein product [Candidula unifasciata]|uniref:DNA polymerase delta subunit 3 n=1 Tax=Candidula unifasciata TaxID=100452 RepID=A0A8S3Z7A0_9EUPU|nr:unnamed protein product [Candidula unifasciata]